MEGLPGLSSAESRRRVGYGKKSMTPTENTSVSVVVVDDEPTIRISTERMLRDEGYETFAAATGAALRRRSGRK